MLLAGTCSRTKFESYINACLVLLTTRGCDLYQAGGNKSNYKWILYFNMAYIGIKTILIAYAVYSRLPWSLNRLKISCLRPRSWEVTNTLRK